MSARVLIVDDDAGQCRLIARWLDRENLATTECGSRAEALEAFTQSLPDVVLLDLYLGDDDGLQVLQEVLGKHPGVPVIMLTAETSIDVVVRAMQLGAYDYLTKPMTRTKLVTTVRNAVEKSQLRVKVRQLEREASQSGFGDLLGESPVMKRLFRQLDRVAPSDVTVLLQGESGTGKELVAQALHDGSGRRTGPFVAINCAAIPENLQESELFGHEKGAFTGADKRRAGRFEAAHGGTLFLDEVGELTPALQAKLLRVLQERRFYRVGGDNEVSVDVRIVAATHKDLETASQQGSFREDLFYRLAVFELGLPPLRDRGHDVVRIAEHLLSRECAKQARVLNLSDEARSALLAYSWPGNVRELGNAMARAAVASEGPDVQLEDLPPRIRSRRNQRAPAAGHSNDGPPDLSPMQEMERQAIQQAIRDAGGNLSAVIRTLGIPRTTFYRKLKKYGLDG